MKFQSTGDKMKILKLPERRKGTQQVISKDRGQTSAEEILSDTGSRKCEWEHISHLGFSPQPDTQSNVRGERNLFQLCRLSNLALPHPFSGSEWRICSTEKRGSKLRKRKTGDPGNRAQHRREVKEIPLGS